MMIWPIRFPFGNYYDYIERGYEELHKEEQEKKIEILKKYVIVKPEEKLLDVGCGTGLTTIPWECKRYGIDPARKLLERAWKPLEVEYKKARAERIPYPDHYFDWVISVTAIQNFSNLKKGLKEIKRVGKERFALTALKRSWRIRLIEEAIREIFQVKEVIEEEKDLIFII
ncbi:MAG: class I SAM-dependent methyltransferase [Nanoarchaeota archaeon]|nr:class I SAM-dependent methyltransferase [Nanoarchaeota archaeon]